MKKLIFILICLIALPLLSLSANAALSDGLLSYWSFDNNANDVKSTRHGTLNNGVSFSNSDCRLGSCYSFDGQDDYISISSSGLQLSSTLTWSGWVKKDGPQPAGYGVFVNGVSGMSVSRLMIGDNGVLAQVYAGGGNHAATPASFAANVWHHVVYTYDGTNAKWYVDGIEFAPLAQNNLPTGTGLIFFGRGQSYATYYLDGKLDEVGVWNRALSLAEITQLYNNGNGVNAVTGIASNCNDADMDGYGLVADIGCRYPTIADCNDSNPTINPGATETCNNIDDNCNSQVDENGGCIDTDGDLIVDAVDICPADQANLCSVNKTQMYMTSNSSTLISTQNGESALQITQGDITSDTVITIEKNNGLAPNFALSTGTPAVKNIFSYSYSPQGTTFSGTITIGMYWQDQDNNGREDTTNQRENTMDIYWYNTISTQWEAQGATCDLVNNYCTLVTNHFSDYALAVVVDLDQDGWLMPEDCDELNPNINPGQYEIPGNSLDENCDSVKVCDSSEILKNHGQFVSCVTQEVEKLFNQELISISEKASIIKSAAKTK